MSRFAAVVGAPCPDCGRPTVQAVEFARDGRPAVLECTQCGYGEICPGVGPDDLWQSNEVT
jgi:hypothetical protein